MGNLSNKTKALHSGHDVKQTIGTRAVPIYQNTAYVFNSTEHAANLFSLKEFGYIYTRLNNPTNDILEKRLADLSGGIGAVSFISGTAAVSSTLLTLLNAGDHIVSSSSLYGGTYNMLNITLPRFDINTTFVDANDVANFELAITDKTKIIFIESLGNPKLDVLDIAAIAKIAKKHKILFIVDNTVPTPALLKPIEFGADIIIHSLTKYISGHGSTLGGIVIDAGSFDWSNGTFPELNGHTKAYHGLNYFEALGNLAFLVKLRIEGLRDFGAAISPFNAFQIIQGLETLEVRIKEHSKNALELAKWLQNHDKVAWVNYPGLVGDNYYYLAQKYLKNGQSGIVTFGLKGGFEAAEKLSNSTKLFSLIANFGDTKSIIIHPASTTHQQLSEAEQLTTGVSQDLIRLSVGIEGIDDLKKDLEQGLKTI